MGPSCKIKKEKKIYVAKKPINISCRKYIQWLESELFKLKTENAYLKELRRLQFQEDTVLKRRQCNIYKN